MTAVEDALAAELDAEPVTPKRRTKAQPMHATLAEALSAAQAEMPAVEKDSVNPHFKSKFTSLDHLISRTRPVLNRHGLSLTQWPTIFGGEPALRTRLKHVSGEMEEDVMPLILNKQDMQALGGAISYARRYAWSAALGISTDEDDDGNQASQKPAGAARTPREQKTDAQNVLASADDLAAYSTELTDAGFDAAEILATHQKRNERLTPAFVTEQRERLAAFVADQAAALERDQLALNGES